MVADNVIANAGSGGSTFRTFSDGSIEWPGSVTCFVTGGSAGAWTLSNADTNSGNKSAATQRVVIATDQPALTNKILVTPDSVALPANQSVNVNQLAGTGTDTNSGTKSAGTLRVVIATDQPTLTNALTVTANAGTNLNTSALALDTSINGILVAQASTTSGQSGPLAQTATTTNAPTYTTAKTNPLSTDTAGLLRVSVKDTPANTNKFLVTPDSVALPANQSVNVNQLAGTATDTNSGNKSAGTLRVVLATDQPALTNKILVTPDALPANQSVNVNQLAGTATSVNSGTKDAGTLRVVIATDQPALTNALLASQSGTWTVQPGNTPNTSPWLTTQTPAASGGLSISRTLSANNTTGISAKGSTGQVFGWAITNSNASARFVKLYNKATAPTVGTDTPVVTLLIPGNANGAGMIAEYGAGIAFGTGIGYGITTGVADADTGAPAANEVIVNLFYK